MLSNSPGEVSGWMGPVARALSSAGFREQIVAVTLPCPYASGREGAHAGTMPGVARVENFSAAIRAPKKSGRSLVLQLGGDPMYGWALSKRQSCPWMIYTARPRWRGKVAHYFIPDETARERFDRAGVAEERRTLVGNLILDSVERPSEEKLRATRARYAAEGEEIIIFMAGSRPFEYELGVGFFCECAALLRERFTNWRPLFPIAPTVHEETLRSGLKKAGLAWRGGDRVEEIILRDGSTAPLVREGQYDAIAAASLAVAFPGTNNLQIASLGVPLLMIAPLNYAHEIPLDGIPGLIPRNNRLASAIKERLVHWYNEKHKFVSLPNMIAGRELLPERRELMTPESAARYIAELVASPERRRAIVEGCAALDFTRGAAHRIAREICEYFDGE